MTAIGGWEKLRELGKGGQSEVFLARSPERVAHRTRCLLELRTAWDRQDLGVLATNAWEYARPDHDLELGALKVFKLLGPSSSTSEDEAVERLKNEISILKENRPGLPRLLADNPDESWFVTEYFREGSLEKQLWKYKNNVPLALKAFRSLLSALVSIHAERIVHRDIKPANIFVRRDDELVLGDFGIVFLPNGGDRLTVTGERVGPRDYMAPWMDREAPVQDVHTCSDVYMLGKLLWCMISGKLKLHREDHKRRECDVEMMFPNTPNIDLINPILDKCLVSEPEQCLSSAQELLQVVDKTIYSIEAGESQFFRKGKLRLACNVCGKGTYKPVKDQWGAAVELHVKSFIQTTQVERVRTMRAFVCDICTHHALFALGYPDDAASILGVKVPS